MFRILLSWIAVVVVTSECGRATADTPLRIVTFNTEILNAPGVTPGELAKYRWDVARRAQFERVASLVEALNPDVLNLCEVTSQESVDLLVEILHEKGLTDLVGYHVENNDTFTGMDVALISRIRPVPIDGQSIRTMYSEPNDPTWRQAYQVTSPPRHDQTQPNRIQRNTSLSRNAVYLLEVGGYKLGFLGLHLKSNPSDEFANAQRSAQVEIARRIIQQEIVSRDYLPVVLGDLNDYDPDVPDRDDARDTATNVLGDLKNFDPDLPGPELVNVAERMPRQADRYTSLWDRNENGVMDPYDVMTMIDHILLPKELMSHVRRAFIFHSIDLTTTDHQAVVIDLVLPEPAHSTTQTPVDVDAPRGR